MPEPDYVDHIQEPERARHIARMAKRERLHKLLQGAQRAKRHMEHAQKRNRIPAANRWRMQLRALVKEVTQVIKELNSREPK